MLIRPPLPRRGGLATLRRRIPIEPVRVLA